MTADDKPKRYGWRVSDWGEAVSCGRATVWRLIAEGKIESVSIGRRRVITTQPDDFLARLAAEQRGEKS